MFAFESHYSRFLWAVLCHSLWSVPLISLISAYRIESLSPKHGDRRMRCAILACLITPFSIALLTPAFESIASGSSEFHFETPVVFSSSMGIESTDAHRPVPDRSNHAQPSEPAFPFPFEALLHAAIDMAVPAWLAGMTVLTIRMMMGVLFFRARSRFEKPAPMIRSMADKMARSMRIRNPPEILVSNHANQPMVIGLLRPCVILPRHWVTAPDDDRFEAVLAHELAHIRRRDLTNLLFERIAGILWFFHPTMHRLNRQATLWREIAADRLATEVTGDPLALARALESAATRAAMHLNGWNRTGSYLANAAVGPECDLRIRIEKILNTKGTRRMKFGMCAKSMLTAMIFMGLGYGLMSSSNTIRAPEGLRFEHLGIEEVHIKASGRFDDREAQIAHGVSFVSLESGKLDELLKQSAKRIRSNEATACWLIPANDVTSFLVPIRQGLEHGTVTSWPKVTSFNRQRIEYAVGIETPIVTGWSISGRNQTGNANTVRIEPELTNYETGIRFDITSELKDNSTSIELTGRYAGLKIRKAGDSKESRTRPGTSQSSYNYLSDISQSDFEVKADISDTEMLIVKLDESFVELPDRNSNSIRYADSFREFRSMQRFMIVKPVRIDVVPLQ